MTSRQYRDPSGTLWEVFEVHRHTDRATAVRPSLMSGWLAFVSANEKRRLPHYPADWTELGDDELYELYQRARLAPAPLYPVFGTRGPDATERRAVPRDEPHAPAPPPPAEQSPAERLVREHAQRSRANGIPVINAMVEMKRLLKDSGEDLSPEALRNARRWFVESFYFRD